MESLIVTTNEGRLAVENKAQFAAQIAAITELYTGRIVTDKAEAKKDRATINKMLKAIDEKRKEAKRQYEAPFKTFESELKELTEPLKVAGEHIDAQIKAIEDGERKERIEWIKEEYSKFPTDIPLSEVWDEAWTNLSKSKQSIISELTMALVARANGKNEPNVFAPTSYTPTGVPVYNFAETREYTVTFFCTSSQLDQIENFADKLNIAYLEVSNG